MTDEEDNDDEGRDGEIVGVCNRLAAVFYRMHGFDVPEDFKFYAAEHLQEISMWNLAAAAVAFIDGDDVDACLKRLGLKPAGKKARHPTKVKK